MDIALQEAPPAHGRTRAVVVATLVMGLTVALQVLLVSFLSTSKPYENAHCPILHEILPFVDERFFLGIKLVTLVGVQLIVMLGSC